MGASKPASTNTAHLTLAPTVKNISQATIRKKWKPLPPPSQDKIRHILLNLRSKRSGAGGNGRIPTVGKARSRTAGSGKGTMAASKNAIAEEEYGKVVEEVTEKLLNRLPRMPFPPTSATTTLDDFDLSSTLTRISTLQAQLISAAQSAHLLRRQITREKAALKRDQKELKTLEEGLRSSRELRKRKERGLHAVAREGGSQGDRDDDGEEGEFMAEIERVNDIAGIGGSSGKGTFGTSMATAEPTLSLDDDMGPELHPLLKQLHSHLLSMRNNTTSMTPVLNAMDGAKVALDKFASRSLDDEALRRLYGIAVV